MQRKLFADAIIALRIQLKITRQCAFGREEKASVWEI